MLDNFRLRVFRAVAEHLSFRKAGEKLYLTQPAVTLQIKTLEEELGARFFERSASGVALTEAGNTLSSPYADPQSNGGFLVPDAELLRATEEVRSRAVEVLEELVLLYWQQSESKRYPLFRERCLSCHRRRRW